MSEQQNENESNNDENTRVLGKKIKFKKKILQ